MVLCPHAFDVIWLLSGISSNSCSVGGTFIKKHGLLKSISHYLGFRVGCKAGPRAESFLLAGALSS